MSDLINRTEIISTFTELGKTGRYGGMCEWVIEIVKQLPPAELSTNLAEVGTDLVSRAAAIDALRMVIGDNRSISVCDAIKQLPPIQPKTGKWIIDRSGAYCCSKCMEPCATYVMMKPRDKFCKMCGAKMEVTT